MKHICYAEGCSTAVPLKHLMCGKHWAMVPQTQRTEIWRHYRDGQEIDKRPSTEYLRVMKIAIDLVARVEGQQVPLL